MEVNKAPEFNFGLQFNDFDYLNECVHTIAALVNSQNLKGVIILLNDDVRDFVYDIEKAGVNLANLYFVDCLSVFAGRGTPPVKNCLTIDKPNDYESIMLATFHALRRLKTKRAFIFFVSSRLFLAYDNIDEVGIFFNTFIKRMRQEKVLTVIGLSSGNPEFSQVIRRLLETTITYEGWLEAFA